MKNIAAFLIIFLAGLGPTLAHAGPTDREAAKSAQMHYMRGMLLERRGSIKEALEAYEQAFAFDHESAYICTQAVELAIEAGLMPKAALWVERLAKLAPKKAQTHILLGRLQWAEGKIEAAQASFETALKLDPRSAESIFSLGSILSVRAPQKARELLERFLEQNPVQAAEAHFQIAKLDLQANNLKGAETHLKTAIAVDPDTDSLPARYALAQTYELQHSTDAALETYLDILKLEPQNVPLLNHVAQIYFLKGQWEEMNSHLETAKSFSPDDPTANHWLALYAERRGDFARAASYLKASAILKDEPALNLRLSYYLTQAGLLKEAVVVLETAARRWPANDQIAYFLALGYEDIKKEGKAIKILRQVTQLKPDYRDARYQLGVLLEKNGDIAQAEKEFRLLLAQKPDDAAILNYLGYSLADRGMKLGEAESLVSQAVGLDPKNGAFLDSLGWVHFKQGKSTEAVSDLRKALEALPEDETIWEHLGDAYAAMGDNASAWRFWKRSEFLYPAGVPTPNKSARLEPLFSAGQLGAYYLDYLQGSQGGIQKFSGMCELSGRIAGQAFQYTAILTFKNPNDLDVDILGPLFTPIFRIRLNEQGFIMDPIALPSVPQEALLEAAASTFGALRDYLSGRVFSLRPAAYKRGWRSRSLLVPGWRLFLDRKGLALDDLMPLSGPVSHLRLGEFSSYKGRQVPRRVAATGRGFSLEIRFTQVNIDLAPPGVFKP